MKLIILIIGESGSGKSTLAKNLVKEYPNIYSEVISATTRKKRNNEVSNKDYYFLNVEKFKIIPMIEKSHFNNNWYGIPTSELTTEKNLICVLEPIGAKNVMTYIETNQIYLKPIVIFLDIDKKTRKKNMLKRGDSKLDIMQRLQNTTITDNIKNIATQENFYKIEKLTKNLYKIIHEKLFINN